VRSSPPRYVSLYLDIAIRLKGKPVGPWVEAGAAPQRYVETTFAMKHWALPGKRRTVGRTRPVLRPRARRPASAGERSPSTWRPWEAREGRAFRTKACLRVCPHGSESPEGATTNRGVHVHDHRMQSGLSAHRPATPTEEGRRGLLAR